MAVNILQRYNNALLKVKYTLKTHYNSANHAHADKILHLDAGRPIVQIMNIVFWRYPEMFLYPMIV
jgi:hypothetical protein